MKQGYSPILTREPGGTALGEGIRKILLDSKGLDISDVSEFLLFEAARSQIVKEVIMPALKRGRIVISDRFSDATVAYQGYGNGLDLTTIKRVDDIASMGLKPGITILLDIKTRLGLGRAREKGTDRIEARAIAYHRRVRAGYLALAKKDRKRIRVVRVKGSIKATQDLVRREVSCAVQGYKRSG